MGMLIENYSVCFSPTLIRQELLKTPHSIDYADPLKEFGCLYRPIGKSHN